MACSSDRIGHSWQQFFDAAHNHDIVLLSMPSVFRGTLDVLSMVPGAHLPVKAFHFHPRFPAFRHIRPGTRLGTASSPAFRLSGTVSLLHRFPGLAAIVFLGLFGQPAQALQHGTAFSLTFRSTRSGASARNGILPGHRFRRFRAEQRPDRVFGTTVRSFCCRYWRRLPQRATHAGSPWSVDPYLPLPRAVLRTP